MQPVFSAPLQSLIKPAYRNYDDQSVARVPTPEEFELQLEGRWQGVAMLPQTRQQAFQQLAMRIRRVKAHEGRWAFLTFGEALPEPDEVDTQIAKPASQDFTPAAISFDQETISLIDDIATRHAYVGTVTIALIAAAKSTSGILPSTDFMWTRGNDVQFWRMINGYGRPRVVADIAGAYAHYKFELKSGKALEEAFFEKTVVNT
jgi:hypothetical protein